MKRSTKSMSRAMLRGNLGICLFMSCGFFFCLQGDSGGLVCHVLHEKCKYVCVSTLEGIKGILVMILN